MNHLAETRGIDVLDVVQRAARVNWRSALHCPELAGRVEILERETDRIGDLMAAGANGVFAVKLQPVASHIKRRFGIVDGGKINVWRRIGNFLAEEYFTHRPPAFGRRSAAGMGIKGEESRQRENAGAHVAGRRFIGRPVQRLLHRHVIDHAEAAAYRGLARGEEIAVVRVLPYEVVDYGA